MAFHPFGDVVEINSSLPVEELKGAIRARKTRWIDSKHGARGWIAGSIVCLWSDALGRHMPVVLGKIEADGAGSRMRLRSVSAFNSVLFPLGGLGGFGLGRMRFGLLDGVGPALLLGMLCFLTLLGFWHARASRGDADDLVNFLRKVAIPKAKLEHSRHLKPPPEL